MSIKYPLRVEQADGAVFGFIRDASDRVIAGGLSRDKKMQKKFRMSR